MFNNLITKQIMYKRDISILREPEGGVFGVGGTKALVRISVRNGLKNRNGRNYKPRNRNERPRNRRDKFEPKKPRVEADPKKQLEVSISFLEGLIKSFGLKGSVEGETEDRNLLVKVTGEQIH